MGSYNEALRTFFARMQEMQWLPKNDLEASQRLQLKEIIFHAARTSPFYKDRLAPLLRDGSGFDEDRWHEIPILKRSDMHNHQKEMVSNDIPAQDGVVLQYATSGSTGVPVQIKWTALSAAARQAALWRMYLWHNFDFAQTFAFAKDAAPWQGLRLDLACSTGFWHARQRSRSRQGQGPAGNPPHRNI